MIRCICLLGKRRFKELVFVSLQFSFAMSIASSLTRRNGVRLPSYSMSALSSRFVSFTQTIAWKRFLSSSIERQRSIQAFIEGAPVTVDAPGGITLTRSAVHRMCVADLRCELHRRQRDTSGTKKDLVPRLLDLLSTEHTQQRTHHATDVQTTQSSSTLAERHEPPGPDLVSPDRRYILQVKGLSSHSSNGTGVGFVLIDEKNPSDSWEARKYLRGNRSVFEAEYSALVLAMRFALRKGVNNILLQLDHDVIQQQIIGTFAVEKESLKNIYWKFMIYRERLASFSTQHIGFLDNHRASDLAKKALATGKSLQVLDSYEPMAQHFHKKMQNGANPLENDHDAGQQTIDPDVTYRLEFDGGARSNPTGIAGAGMVLYDNQDKEIWCGWSFLDQMSNNCAEYWALLLGLKCALSLGIRKIRCQGDSELIIKQVTGVYRVKDQKLKALYEPTREVASKFDECTFVHIYRNANERADWLANYAMDTKSDHGFEKTHLPDCRLWIGEGTHTQHRKANERADR